MENWDLRSVKNINTTKKVLQILSQKILLKLIYPVVVLDNGGLRTAEQQNEIYKQGFSECDGYNKKSYHQSGLAIDYVPKVNGVITWSNGLAFLSNAKVILECWDEMIEAGQTDGLFLHSGIFWNAKDLDGDGFLEVDDKLGWDMAHYELREFEQKNRFKIKV